MWSHSNSSRLREALFRIQEKIQPLGSSNMARWNLFSPELEMNTAQFCQRISALGIDLTQQDVATLWRSVGIYSDLMHFNDFVKFLQAKSIEITPDESKSASLVDVIKKNKNVFLSKLMEADPAISGQVTYRVFSDIVSWFVGDCKQEISILLQKYDPEDTGYLKYFNLLADLCYGERRQPRQEQSPYIAPHIDVSFARTPERIIQTQYDSPYGNRSPYQSPPRTQGNYSPTDYRSPSRDVMRTPTRIPEPHSPGSGGRGKLDPAIFGSPASPCDSPSSGGRGKLDPAIFGQKVTTAPPPPQAVFDPDTSGARPLVGLSVPELVCEISRAASRAFRGGRQAFAKWRGQGDLMEAADLRAGLAQDGGVLISREDAQAVLRRYGGPLSLSSFIRLLADGSEGPMRGGATDEDIAIARIASQAVDGRWEDAVMRSRNAEELQLGLQRLGIRASETELHTLISKLGRTGLANAIRAKVSY